MCKAGLDTVRWSLFVKEDTALLTKPVLQNDMDD